MAELIKNILNVMETLDSKEFEVKDNTNKWYSMKIRPYKAVDSKIDGVVISLYDIDILKKDIASAVEAKEYFEAIINTV